jgi:hypothetical protein
MTPAEATDLAKRIINVWRGGPPLSEWVDTLEPLEAGAAGTAFIRLRRDEVDAPSIARYHAVYRSLHTGEHDQRCPRCQGDHWVELAPDDDRYRHDKDCATRPACYCQGTAIPCPTCNRRTP